MYRFIQLVMAVIIVVVGSIIFPSMAAKAADLTDCDIFEVETVAIDIGGYTTIVSPYDKIPVKLQTGDILTAKIRHIGSLPYGAYGSISVHYFFTSKNPFTLETTYQQYTHTIQPVSIRFNNDIPYFYYLELDWDEMEETTYVVSGEDISLWISSVSHQSNPDVGDGVTSTVSICQSMDH